MIRLPPIVTRTDTRFPYTTLFRSSLHVCIAATRTVAGNEKPNASLSHAPLRRTARLRRGGEGPPVGLGSPQARPWQPAVRGPARSSWHHPDRGRRRFGSVCADREIGRAHV